MGQRDSSEGNYLHIKIYDVGDACFLVDDGWSTWKLRLSSGTQKMVAIWAATITPATFRQRI